MIDINILRKNTEEIKRGLASKNFDLKIVDKLMELDSEWRELRTKIDTSKAKQREFEKAKDIESAKKIKAEINALEESVKKAEESRVDLMFEIPNIPFPHALVGKGESDNKVIREVGGVPKFKFPSKHHLELGEALGIIDTKKASEVSGSRFGYLKGEAVLLEFGLVKFALDKLMPHGFIPVVPPVMIKPEVYMGMGRLSKNQKEERYYLAHDDLYLVGSAEHTTGPLHMNEVFASEDLPRRYVAFSTCFRREAGSYGKDTKGILRVHQFDKVELFSFTTLEDSEKEHEFLLSMQEMLFRSLEIPYRILEICTGDMGFTDAKQFDIEAWMPHENKYRETGSCSNTTDFQARGINVKYRPSFAKASEGKQEKLEFVHMLNATAFAIGRTLIALMENNQNEDGSINIPEELRPYVGFDKIPSK